MLKSRAFNQILIVNDSTIRKAGSNKEKIAGEYSWLSSDVPFRRPNVYRLILGDDMASYDMDYIHGRTLAELYVNESMPKDEFCYLLESIEDTISKAKECSHFTEEADEHLVAATQLMYGDKTRSRLEAIGLDLDRELTLNGRALPTINKIIDDCVIPPDSESMSIVHGDLCFSNMILEDKYGTNDGKKHSEDFLYYIDPRGVLPGKLTTIYGDVRYDIAKLAHSVIGMYDMIKADKLRAVRTSGTNFIMNTTVSPYKSYVMTFFQNLFGSRGYWDRIMIHLFLSMIPLHSDNPFHQDTMLANALRLYTRLT